MLAQGEFEAANAEKKKVFEEYNETVNTVEELTQKHEAVVSKLAMTMDTELFKLKEEYESRI